MERRNSLYSTPMQNEELPDGDENNVSDETNPRPLKYKFNGLNLNNNCDNEYRFDWTKYSSNGHPTLQALKNAFKEDHQLKSSLDENQLQLDGLQTNSAKRRNMDEAKYLTRLTEDSKLKKFDLRRTLIPRPNTPPICSNSHRSFHNETPRSTISSTAATVDEPFFKDSKDVHNSTNISAILAAEVQPKVPDHEIDNESFLIRHNTFETGGNNDWNRMNFIMLIGLFTAVLVSKALQYFQLFFHWFLNQIQQLRYALVGSSTISTLLHVEANNRLTSIATKLLLLLMVFILSCLCNLMTILHFTASFLLTTAPTGLVDFLYKFSK